MEEIWINSAEEMVSFGETFTNRLSEGATVAIVGNLGAGKTHFTKGVCQGLGNADSSSPTFTLVNEVITESLPVYHFDFYRIKQVEELYDLGWDDYLEKGGVVIAEWADLYPELFPEGTIWLKIEHHEDRRRVLIKVV